MFKLLDCYYKSLIKQECYDEIASYVDYYKHLFLFFYLFSPNIKMSGKNIIFDNKKINKRNFYKNRKLFKRDDIDINKILISKKEF